MRVLHVSTARTWRGGETQLLHLVRGTDDAVALPPAAPLREVLPAGSAVPVPFRGPWRGGMGLRAAIRRLAPDLVAAHDAHAAAHALAVSAVPVVVHRRVDFRPSLLGRRRYRRAAGVVAVSDAVASVLREAGVARVVVVRDGVDPRPLDAAVADPEGVRAELGLPDGAPLVLAVGALAAHKGHAVLVDALAALPGVHAVVLGEGEERRRLVARARRSGVEGRLHLPGHRADVPRWLASADVVVHPSLEEGLGQAVVEALFAGAAVVATRAGGLPETGPAVLVAPGDADALARALRDALRDPEPLRLHARNARGRLLDAFGVDRLRSETHRAYEAFSR